MSQILKAQVKDRKIWYDNNKLFEWILMGFEGKFVDIVIRDHVEQRTIKMNKYYWAYLKIVEDETGNDSADMHEYFKRIFLPPKFIKVFGKNVKIPGSTARLSKKEFSEYIKKIEVETGILAPDPTQLDLCEEEE